MSISKSRDLLCQFQQRDDSQIDGGLSKKINDGRFLLQCLNGKLRVLGMEKRITSERKISLKLIRCSGYINGRKLQQGLVNKNNNGGGGGGSREELDEFVKMMREAQPYFKAHGGSTFVVVLSGNVVDSSYLFPILEPFHLSPPLPPPNFFRQHFLETSWNWRLQTWIRW